MFRLLKTDIREQKKENTVNDLYYEVRFENRVKDKNNVFIKQNIDFLL